MEVLAFRASTAADPLPSSGNPAGVVVDAEGPLEGRVRVTGTAAEMPR